MVNVDMGEPASAVRRRPRPRLRVGWSVVTLTSLAVAGYSLALYAQGSLRELAADGLGMASAYSDAPWGVRVAFYLHVGSASLALLFGPWQFARPLRRRFPAAHRYVGRFYLVAIAVGAVSGLVVIPFNSAKMVGFFGFAALDVLWAYTALRGYRAIRGGDLAGHQAWMIRNYAFTYAAPALRIWLGVLIMVQLPFAAVDADFDALFTNAYQVVPFLCWLPNVVIAEWLVRRRGLPSYRLPGGDGRVNRPEP